MARRALPPTVGIRRRDRRPRRRRARRDRLRDGRRSEGPGRDGGLASDASPPAASSKNHVARRRRGQGRALAPELWRALDANDHGDAASCYLAVAALTTQAQGALGPVARMLRTRVCSSDRFVSVRRTDAESPSSVYAAAVAARVLCDACESGRGVGFTTFSRVATGVVVYSEADPEKL